MRSWTEGESMLGRTDQRRLSAAWKDGWLRDQPYERRFRQPYHDQNFGLKHISVTQGIEEL